MCQCLQKALSLEIFSGLGKLRPNEAGKSMPVVIFFFTLGRILYLCRYYS